MASGDSLFILLPTSSIPTTTAYATLDTLSDASTVVGTIPVLDFAGATADEHAEWVVGVPANYSGTTGFTWKLFYAMDGTNAKAIQFEIRADVIASDEAITSQNLGAQTATTITSTPVSATANDLTISGTAAQAKANFGSAAAGSVVRIRLSRNYDYDGGSGANTDDAQVVLLYGTET